MVAELRSVTPAAEHMGSLSPQSPLICVSAKSRLRMRLLTGSGRSIELRSGSSGRRNAYRIPVGERLGQSQWSSQNLMDTLGGALEITRSGYRARLREPAKEDARLRLIRVSYKASHGTPRMFLDLRETGETCSKHRMERLMRVNSIRTLHGSIRNIRT